ncbi:hypothetical protein TrVGV298_009007 [Trichoderma virens]|nr:hypothetical protein TrVGV298_009007 [Trichoderma virens]
MQEAEGGFFSSQVLCSFKSKDYLYLYTASISSFLLDMFDDSSISPPTPICTSVEVHEVPISPPQTLRARLLTLLCPSMSTPDIKRNLDNKAPDTSLPTTVGCINLDQM